MDYLGFVAGEAGSTWSSAALRPTVVSRMGSLPSAFRRGALDASL